MLYFRILAIESLQNSLSSVDARHPDNSAWLSSDSRYFVHMKPMDRDPLSFTVSDGELWGRRQY